MRFCPICGKKGIKGDFCSECKPQELNLSFKDIHVKMCIICNSVLIGNSWKPCDSIANAIIKTAKFKIKNPENLPLNFEPVIGDDVLPKPGLNRDISIIVHVGDDSFEIPAKISFTYCPRCGKKDSQYFEGILQLRNVSDEVIDFVENKLKKAEDRKVFVNDRRGVINGIDYYITDKKFLRRLGSELKKNFDGHFSESAQLFSRDSLRSKDIYRVNVLFRGN